MIVVICFVLLGLACLALTWIDIRDGIIPDWLNAAIALVGALRAGVIDGWPLLIQSLAEGLVVGAVVWLLRALYFRLRKIQGLGLGDVKLLAASAIWLGIAGIPLQLLLASVVALTTALALHVAGSPMTRRTALPFGPFLALGLLATLALQQGDWIG